MRQVSFDVTMGDARRIREIVERATALGYVTEGQWMEANMDVTAVHANGCPLDLDKFLAFDEMNFGHDFNGIRRHIDRNTGKLTAHFDPRCSKAVPA